MYKRQDGISQLGRNTQGVRIIRMRDGEHVVALERIMAESLEDGEPGDQTEDEPGDDGDTAPTDATEPSTPDDSAQGDQGDN